MYRPVYQRWRLNWKFPCLIHYRLCTIWIFFASSEVQFVVPHLPANHQENLRTLETYWAPLTSHSSLYSFSSSVSLSSDLSLCCLHCTLFHNVSNFQSIKLWTNMTSWKICTTKFKFCFCYIKCQKVTCSGKVNFSNWTRALSILAAFLIFADFVVSNGSSANELDMESSDFFGFTFGDFVWNFRGRNRFFKRLKRYGRFFLK